MRSRIQPPFRVWVATAVVLSMVLAPSVVSAAKPPPKPPVLKASAVVTGFNTTVNYQVNVPASAIASQDCVLTFPRLLSAIGCDFTPNSGSGTKLTKFSLDYETLQAGGYTFDVSIDLVGGGRLSASTSFSVSPGPAVRLSVTGLVEQPAICHAGIDCVGFPGPDYPRQVATITARDIHNNVATGYNGTVHFQTPISNWTPEGMSNATLTNGVAHVAVLVPRLGLGFFAEPFTSNCPSGSTGNGVVLFATDTLDPTIFGCQNIPGGFLSIIFPAGFTDFVSGTCPTGCFYDPTQSITIAPPNIFVPAPITPTIEAGGTMTAVVQSTTGNYATVPIDLSATFIEGNSIPLNVISGCVGCTTDLNYYVPSATTVLDGNLVLSTSTISMPGEITVTGGFWADFDEVTVTSVVAGGSTPTCYLESQLITVLSLTECGEDPFGL